MGTHSTHPRCMERQGLMFHSLDVLVYYSLLVLYTHDVRMRIVIIIINKFSMALFPVKTSSTRLIPNVQPISKNGCTKHTNFKNFSFDLYLPQRAYI